MKGRGWFAAFVACCLTMLSVPAFAADVTLSWQWPTQYCNGDNLPLTDIVAAEIYIATSPIPRVPSSCDENEQDVPPSGAVIQQVTTPDTTVAITLDCGSEYHFVMRVQAANGEWSNFSAEAMRDLTDECGRPGIPIIISLS